MTRIPDAFKLEHIFQQVGPHDLEEIFLLVDLRGCGQDLGITAEDQVILESGPEIVPVVFLEELQLGQGVEDTRDLSPRERFSELSRQVEGSGTRGDDPESFHMIDQHLQCQTDIRDSLRFVQDQEIIALDEFAERFEGSRIHDVVDTDVVPGFKTIGRVRACEIGFDQGGLSGLTRPVNHENLAGLGIIIDLVEVEPGNHEGSLS